MSEHLTSERQPSQKELQLLKNIEKPRTEFANELRTFKKNGFRRKSWHRYSPRRSRVEAEYLQDYPDSEFAIARKKYLDARDIYLECVRRERGESAGGIAHMKEASELVVETKKLWLTRSVIAPLVKAVGETAIARAMIQGAIAGGSWIIEKIKKNPKGYGIGIGAIVIAACILLPPYILAIAGGVVVGGGTAILYRGVQSGIDERAAMRALERGEDPEKVGARLGARRSDVKVTSAAIGIFLGLGTRLGLREMFMNFLNVPSAEAAPLEQAQTSKPKSAVDYSEVTPQESGGIQKLLKKIDSVIAEYQDKLNEYGSAKNKEEFFARMEKKYAYLPKDQFETKMTELRVNYASIEYLEEDIARLKKLKTLANDVLTKLAKSPSENDAALYSLFRDSFEDKVTEIEGICRTRTEAFETFLKTGEYPHPPMNDSDYESAVPPSDSPAGVMGSAAMQIESAIKSTVGSVAEAFGATQDENQAGFQEISYGQNPEAIAAYYATEEARRLEGVIYQLQQAKGDVLRKLDALLADGIDTARDVALKNRYMANMQALDDLYQKMVFRIDRLYLIDRAGDTYLNDPTAYEKLYRGRGWPPPNEMKQLIADRPRLTQELNEINARVKQIESAVRQDMQTIRNLPTLQKASFGGGTEEVSYRPADNPKLRGTYDPSIDDMVEKKPSPPEVVDIVRQAGNAKYALIRDNWLRLIPRDTQDVMNALDVTNRPEAQAMADQIQAKLNAIQRQLYVYRMSLDGALANLKGGTAEESGKSVLELLERMRNDEVLSNHIKELLQLKERADSYLDNFPRDKSTGVVPASFEGGGDAGIGEAVELAQVNVPEFKSYVEFQHFIRLRANLAIAQLNAFATFQVGVDGGTGRVVNDAVREALKDRVANAIRDIEATVELATRISDTHPSLAEKANLPKLRVFAGKIAEGIDSYRDRAMVSTIEA